MGEPQQQVQCPASCCLLLVFGAPAVGKTSICQSMRRYLAAALPEIQVAYICLDSIYQELAAGVGEQEVFNPNIWKASRQKAYERAREVVAGKASAQGFTVLCMIDDNLPLSSMRYKYYKLAVEQSTSFIQLLVEADLKTALARNVNRGPPGSVPEEVLIRTLQSLEYRAGCREFDQALLKFANDSNTVVDDLVREQIWPAVEQQWGQPAARQSGQGSAVQVKEAQARTLSNLMHAMDLRTRKHLSLVIGRIKEQQPSTEQLQQHSRALNSIRKGLLAACHTIQHGQAGDEEKDQTLFGHERKFYMECSNYYDALVPDKKDLGLT